jgi:GAF domain-containing protein
MQNWNAVQSWFAKTFRETSEIERDTPSNLRMLRNITITVNVATILMVIFTILQSLYIQATILGVLWLLLNASGILLQKGQTFPARFISPLAILVAVTIIAIRANGLHDSTIVIFPIVIIFASLTLGARGALIFAALTSLATITMGVLEISGIVVNRFSYLTDLTDIILIGILSPIIILIIQVVLLVRLNQNIELAQKSTDEQKEINTQLLALQQNLEQIISDRTSELETKSKQLEDQLVKDQKRANQFQTIADVARYAANIQDVNTLFNTVTKLVSERLGFYHVGIFLNDEADHFAILSAANSEGGQRMLERNHRLKIGEIGIVGNVAYSGIPRVALDTGEDATFFNNPDLPETRSEMAVALKVSNKIIGVIDIQSQESNAFTNEDTEVFAALADQIAIAIENVRLFENTQKSLSESETIYRQYLRSEWGRLTSEEKLTGFQYKITGAVPLDAPLERPDFRLAMQSGDISVQKDEKDESSLVVPIKLRGEILGVVNIRQPGNKSWSKDEIELIQSVTDRLAISAENARLFEESQQRASLEQAIGEISSKLSSSVDLNTVLQTAAEELGRVLHGSDVAIQLVQSEEN